MAAPATVQVFNYLRDSTGAAMANQQVHCILDYNQATVTATGDSVVDLQQTATTDSTGKYTFTVVPNDLLSPTNTTYTIVEPQRSYQIAPQSGNGASQQTTAANVIVNTPGTLTPATQNVTGPLTVTGALTSQTSITDSGLVGGQVVFPSAAGLLSGDSNLFWDNTNKRLGVGTASPSQPVHVVSTVPVVAEVDSSNTGGAAVVLQNTSVPRSWQFAAVAGSVPPAWTNAGGLYVYDSTGAQARFEIDAFSGAGSLSIKSGGHLVTSGPTPTLGALQTGITAQSISGTDSAFAVSLSCGASPPGNYAAIFTVNFATAFSVTPRFAVGFDGNINGGIPRTYTMGTTSMPVQSTLNTMSANVGSQMFNFVLVG